ncbi:MAG: guanylate kinase [Actinomycetota bacterium]|nr:guanylate kinase [Actinomycetota bacterium]
MARRGRLFVISGPSGVGKGTVVRELLRRDPSLAYSVSAKTRRPRAGEVDGREYRFMSEADFDRLVEDDAFLEWAEMFGHRSGTLSAPVEEALAEGRNVILEIDVQGAATVKERVPDAVLVFITPPSRSELVRRLRARGTENEEDFERRLAAVDREMAAADLFDRVVVNDDLERGVAEVAGILQATPPPTTGRPT